MTLFIVISLLFGLLLVGITLSVIWMMYRRTWSGPQRWMEATRHQYRLALIVGRWIWFKWIHLDCQYWILHLDFNAGVIELRGTPPECTYWSITYNTWSEVNPSINSDSIELESDGSYRIKMAEVRQPGNWIPIRPNARLGVIYYRIYESQTNFPSQLPGVWQNEKLITDRALS